MKDHLRHRWWLRALLVMLALVLSWTQWSDDAGANLYLALWAVAAVIGTLGSTFSGWRPGAARGRASRLPYGLQGVFVGAVVGAWLTLLVEGALVASGLIVALLGMYEDLFRAAWRWRPRHAGTSTAVQ